MCEEIFDVVDSQDRVIGRATRREVHAQGLLHRAVHVFVFNSQGELLLQMRSATKDEFPNCYTSSASGHVDTGETYDHAAKRELAEELHIQADLEFVTRLPASPQTANEHTALYRTVTDQPIDFDRDEIAGVEFRSLDKVGTMLERDGDRFSPPFRELLKWYLRDKST